MEIDFLVFFKNNAHQTTYKQHFLPTIKIKDCNVKIVRKNFFDQLVRNDQRTCDNVRKIATSQGDDYTTVYLLHYIYFKNYIIIAIDLSKQKALD